jgi:NAD(P)-dependent dehydrogenase (short-subunit alcohol dehydrogenase family)
MRTRDAVVLVTGASRGLGRAFAEGALKQGARKVYAGVRNPDAHVPEGTVKVVLDVTRPEQAQALGEQLSDVTLLIQNAGILSAGGPLNADQDEELRRQLDTHFWGVLHVARAFSPALIAHQGAMLVVLSAGSWTAHPALGNYGVSKAAAWGLTNNLRATLAPQGVTVTALHAGFIDTDMARNFPGPKLPPSEVVDAAFRGLEAGDREVLVDPFCRMLKAGLSTEAAAYLGQKP